MRTKSTRKEDARANRRWYVVDADGKVLGRLCSQIAHILRGKHKSDYTPHIDTGDFVIVVNASKVRLTGRKETDKLYHRHTGWMGGLVTESADRIRAEHPDRIIKHAIKGMLPKGPLGRAMATKLKVYADAEHPHTAQKPEPLAV